MLLTPAIASARAVIPAGTPVEVRLTRGIDSSRAVPGERFHAIVAEPVVVNNRVVIPRGADAALELIRTTHGQYAVKLNSIGVRGTRYRVASDYATVAAKSRKGKAAKRGAIGAGAGAVVGGLMGGGKGAAIGAGAGAGVGAASALAGGRKVELPPETRLIFRLRSPVAVR